MKARNQTIQEVWIKSFLLVILFMIIAAGMSSCDGNTTPPPECTGVCPEDIDFVEKVFSTADLEETTNIKYGASNQNLTDFIKAEDHPMDDAPLVILVTGGGYVDWTQIPALKGMGKDLAQRGYAFALVKHRIGAAQDFDAYVKATQDVFTAVRYYKENAVEYGIDPNRIIIGGWSTGAVAALNVAFATQENLDNSTNDPLAGELRQAVERQGGVYGDLYPNQTNDIAGVLSMMGYLWDIEILKDSNTPLMMINHEDASIGGGTVKIVGKFEVNGMVSWGTDAIHASALELGYQDEDNLKYIRSNYHNGDTNFSPNVWSLTDNNYDAIAGFFAPHMR